MRRITAFLTVCFAFAIAGKAQTAGENDTEHTFTQRETLYIRVPDPGVFKEGNKHILDFTQLNDSAFAFPLPGAKVISPYGRNGGRHTGCDIKTCANDTIRAAFDGIVRLERRFGGYGNVIVIRHPSGLETVYSHNSKDFVKSGDRVRAGEPIALTGRTGRATTEHLHFETRINGAPFNPNIIMDMNSGKLRKEKFECRQHGTRIVVKPA